MPDQIISQEGYDKLKKEYNYLISAKRKEIADRIQRAKDMGDLNENAEYAEVKDAQAFNEGRIAELYQMLKNLTIVKNGRNHNKVGMGSIVTVRSESGEKKYTIVSFNEADPVTGKISNESPLGMSFINKMKGDKAIVNTPKDEIEYEIINIE